MKTLGEEYASFYEWEVETDEIIEKLSQIEIWVIDWMIQQEKIKLLEAKIAEMLK